LKFKDLHPGQTVFCTLPKIQGGTIIRGKRVIPVKIHRIDDSRQQVQASWGELPPRWHMAAAAHQWSQSASKRQRIRLKKPK
jgi:hypothetical protein